MRYYVDVHRTAKKRGLKSGEWMHVYTSNGVEFGKATRITDISARAGDEIYCDVIPVELTDEFIDPLKRGVRIFYLRRLALLKKTREKLGLSKTSKNDVRAMMHIETKWYKEVDVDFLELRRLIAAYRTALKSHQVLETRMKALGGPEREFLRVIVRTSEAQLGKLAALIVDAARRRIPHYEKAVEVLGISGDNHLRAREALAELMTYNDFRGIRRVKGYVGLFRGKPRRFSGDARRALERLTIAIKGRAGIKARDMVEVLKKIRDVVKEGERLAVPA